MQRGPVDVGHSLRRSRVGATAPTVTVYNDHPSETVDEGALERIVRAVLEAEGVPEATISIVLCDRAAHLDLHQRYLGKDDPTDVLSFPLGDRDEPEGEVYVDLDTARERHPEFGVTFEAETVRYVIHGLLHLLGFDDDEESRLARMRARENEYVERFSSG